MKMKKVFYASAVLFLYSERWIYYNFCFLFWLVSLFIQWEQVHTWRIIRNDSQQFKNNCWTICRYGFLQNVFNNLLGCLCDCYNKTIFDNKLLSLSVIFHIVRIVLWSDSSPFIPSPHIFCTFLTSCTSEAMIIFCGKYCFH